jgi:putative redox protein
MVTITAVYQGDLTTVATHGPSGATLQTDAPKDNQGLGRFFSPTDLVGTALGTCMLTVMGIVGRRNGIDLRGATAKVEKEMREGPRRIGKLTTVITMPSGLSAEDRLLLERTAHTCPVHQSLRADVEKPITFVYPDN